MRAHLLASGVLLWAPNGNSAPLIELVSRLNVPVLGVVGHEKQSEGHVHIRFFTAAQLKEEPAFRNEPVVVGSWADTKGGNDYVPRDSFRASVISIRRMHRITNRILHYSALNDVMPLNFRNYTFCGGMPGAGNVLLQRIVGELLGRKPGILAEQERSAHAACLGYSRSLTDSLDALLEPAGRIHTQTAPQSIGRISAAYRFERRHGQSRDAETLLYAYNLPVRAQFFSQIYATHEVPGQALVKRLKAWGFSQFFVAVRHPLDTVVSIANKIIYPVTGTHAVNVLIDNLTWFEEILCCMGEHFRAVVETRRDMMIVRYEDMIRTPEIVIRRLADHLAVALSEAEIASLSQDYLFRPLDPGNPAHYWAGVAGNWKKYLSAQHLRIYESLPIFQLARELGYSYLSSDIQTYRSGSDSPPLSSTQQTRLIGELMSYSAIIGLKSILKPEASCGEAGELAGIRFWSNNRSYAEEFRRFLSLDYIQAMLGASNLETQGLGL